MNRARRQKDNAIGGGKGGETHQTTVSAKSTLTTNQGVPISDNQNSLKSGARGPTLLEDFVPVSYTHLTLPTIYSV